MEIKISAIGKMKEPCERALLELYLSGAQKFARRLGIPKISMLEHLESRAQDQAGRCQMETEKLFASAVPGDTLVAFDRLGTMVSSEEVAAFVDNQRGQGAGCLHFFLGGPDGFSPALIERKITRWSLGPMTWPHRLARIMVLEQLYRGLTILARHPYHRA